MSERIKFYHRTQTMLKMAIAKNDKSNKPKIFTETVEYRGSRKIYAYPLEDMREMIDTIVVPVSDNPLHDYGRQKVKYRIRIQAARKGIKVSIAYDERQSAIIVTKIA